ncbi:MAG: hypothetical protein ACE5Q6_08565 [Dehalococcoidia bacterium]
MRIFLGSNFTKCELDQLMALVQEFDARNPSRRIVLILSDETQDTDQAQELLSRWGLPYRKLMRRFEDLARLRLEAVSDGP